MPRTDLPLAADAAARLLPALTVALVFLACVALAGAMSLDRVLQRWSRDVSGTVTVQIAPEPGASEETRAATIRQAVGLLRSEPGVMDVRVLDDTEIVRLMEPWLGSEEVVRALPLPRLLDVTVDPERMPDLDALDRNLKAQVPQASLDDHRVWLAKLIGLGEGLALLAAAVVLLVLLTVAVAVIQATRSSLAVHRGTIEVLHLIGAHDGYVARQFAANAFFGGLKGGMIGLALAVPALLGIGWLARRVEGGLVPNVSLEPVHWLVLGLLPLLVALLTMVAAHRTVMRVLGRLP